MKYITLALLSLTTVTGFAQQKKKTSTVKKKTVTTKTSSTNLLVTKADSVSYAFGMDIGKSLKSTEVEYLKADVIAKAIAATLKMRKPYWKMDKQEKSSKKPLWIYALRKRL